MFDVSPWPTGGTKTTGGNDVGWRPSNSFGVMTLSGPRGISTVERFGPAYPNDRLTVPSLFLVQPSKNGMIRMASSDTTPSGR